MEVKLKKCKMKCEGCQGDFKPMNSLQISCYSPKCILKFKDTAQAKKNLRKAEREERKEMKEKTMSMTDYLKILQSVFNTYIRERDRGLPCISCGRVITGQAHASHFFSTGHHPKLRFNEFNVHSSCVECNVHKHGNTSEYATRLPGRIGDENYKNLVDSRNGVLKLTIQEIHELIKKYKDKTKVLKQNK